MRQRLTTFFKDASRCGSRGLGRVDSGGRRSGIHSDRQRQDGDMDLEDTIARFLTTQEPFIQNAGGGGA